ncbi:MAG: monofunctional biosynthetic peptidoglycan transglycosylase [Alphaproteobacteria bacterium]|nr:monofunctional biosynthetic peptidoglycan transglycosylase [Alphaproteobacteria bacterium]
MSLALRVATIVAAAFAALSLAAVLIVRFVDPPGTPAMLADRLLGRAASIQHEWRSLSAIADALKRAVVASEDARFCRHAGFDWREIEDAIDDWADGERLRGASTISMQAARAAFLPPSRTILRKGAEAWLTVLIEAAWPKARVLEVYLNVVEWGQGIYGAEAAARHHFGKPAAALTPREAALLAAILPNPRTWRAAPPAPGVARRADRIQARAAALPWRAGAVCAAG